MRLVETFSKGIFKTNKYNNYEKNPRNYFVVDKLKNINYNKYADGVNRAGIIPYFLHHQHIYYILAIDRKSKNIIDFGGGFDIEKDNNLLDTALREYYEESHDCANILNVCRSIDYDKLKNSLCYIDDNNKTMEIFIKTNKPIEKIINDFHYLNNMYNKNTEYNENSDVIILSEIDLKNIINSKTSGFATKGCKYLNIYYNNKNSLKNYFKYIEIKEYLSLDIKIQKNKYLNFKKNRNRTKIFTFGVDSFNFFLKLNNNKKYGITLDEKNNIIYISDSYSIYEIYILDLLNECYQKDFIVLINFFQKNYNKYYFQKNLQNYILNFFSKINQNIKLINMFYIYDLNFGSFPKKNIDEAIYYYNISYDFLSLIIVNIVNNGECYLKLLEKN